MQSRLAIALTLMVVALALLTAPAGAAVTFGSSLALVPNNNTCNAIGEPTSCTIAIGTLPLSAREAAGVTAPGDGVLVGWKVRSALNTTEITLRLRVLRGNSGVGTGAAEILPASAGIHGYPARLAVKAGDRLGVDVLEVPTGKGAQITRDTTGASADFFVPPLLDGTTRPVNAVISNTELLLQATLEPDGDHDGWGDETQDRCVGRSDPANLCSAPIPVQPAPNTKVKEVKIEGSKATFRFSATVKGSKFQCKLDKKPWKQCKSPKVYSGLKEGRHTFKVKAIGPTAVPDPTPVKRTVKVKP